MQEARTIYLSDNARLKDVGYGFGEDGAIFLNEGHINRGVLFEKCEEASERFGDDFTVVYQDEKSGDAHIFRGRRATSSIGQLFALREIHKGLPTLKDDALGIPSFYKDIVSHSFLLGGGMFVIAGAAGNGKSTTLAATLIHRLACYGGFAISIEDPPEYQLTGKIGRGFCFQLPVCKENGGDFAGAIKASLRMYPSRQPATILSIGEIRDAASAASVLRESINGHLVLTTIHANDVQNAVSRILSLASQELGIQEASDLLAQSLRVFAHQRIVNGRPLIKVLINDGSNNLVAARIRSGEVHSLNSEILRQNTLINKMNVLPLENV